MFLIELITGLARNFPITMTGVTLIGGLALGNLAWLFMGLASITVVLLCMVIQLPLGTSFADFPRSSDAAILRACSLLPSATSPSSVYFPIPSMWIALSTFFLTYIFFNALRVYNTPSTKLPREALPVQHRKSIGVVSLITTLMVFFGLILFRINTGCEHMTMILGIPIPFGLLGGILIGGLLGGGLYTVFQSNSSSLNTDVHGVLSGLQSGTLRDHPLACAPRSATNS